MSVLVDSVLQCIDPHELLQECHDREDVDTSWAEKANQFFNPLGRGPGTGGILLRDFDLASLDLTIDHTLAFQDDVGNSRVLQRITLVRGKCVIPSAPDNDNAAFLVDVEDRRRFLAKVPVDKGYNIAAADGTSYLSQSLNSGSQWTWQGVVQDLCTALGLGTQALPFSPDSVPENLLFFGSYAWEAVNQVLDRLACTFKYDIEADEFTIIRLGDTTAAGSTAETSLTSQLDRQGLQLWNAYWNEPNRGRFPANIRVLFPRRPQPTDGSSIFYKVDVSTGVTSVEAGTYEILHDDLTAVGSGTPTNAAALATRATERASDWLRKRLYSDSRQMLVYKDFQRASVLLCETTGAVSYDERRASQIAVLSEPDGALERFRAYEQPLVLPTATSAPAITSSPSFTDTTGSGAAFTTDPGGSPGAAFSDTTPAATTGRGCMGWAHGWVDRSGGAGAIELRIGFVVTTLSGSPASKTIYYPITLTCPNNERTSWSIAGFIPLHTGSTATFGVAVEVTVNGSPTATAPPTAICSAFHISTIGSMTGP